MKTIDQIEISNNLRKKIEFIKKLFVDKRILISYSGGIDSSLVCYLGLQYAKEIKAMTINTPMTPKTELEQARIFCQLYAIPFEEIRVNILEIPEIKANTSNRCYYCKKKILNVLQKKADQEHFDLICDGTNFSDLSELRPGLNALKESGIHSPLAEAQISKKEIIQLTNLLDLPSKDIPTMACLASRIPFDIPLSENILEKIDDAEQSIRTIINNKTSPLRVRIHPLGSMDKLLARIEVHIELIPVILEPLNTNKIVKKLKSIGFYYVTIDLEGFTSGSLHNLL